MNQRNRLLACLVMVATLEVSSGITHGQGRIGDVMITVINEKVVVIPAAGSRIEEELGDNESVMNTTARGQTGCAQTSARLLGFSSELRRWTEVPLGVEERVEHRQVLPRLIGVQKLLPEPLTAIFIKQCSLADFQFRGRIEANSQ